MQPEVTGRRIAKNTTFYITALTLQKGLSFLYFTLLARSLGAALTGKYVFALSLAGIIIGIIDIGLTPALTRDVAKDRSKARSFLGHTLALKVVLGIVMAIGFIVVSRYVAPEPLQRHLLFIALAVAFFDTIALSLFATVRAFQNLWYESVSAVIFQLVVLSLGSVALFSRADVRLIMGALLVASMVNCGIGIVVVKKFFARTDVGFFSFDGKILAHLLYLAAPFALATICTKVNAYTDMILVKALLNDTALGLYSVAYKITFAFQFIPMAFVASLYPAFAYLWQHDQSRLSDTFVKACTYLAVFSVPVTAFIAAVSDVVIPLVYRSEYQGSVAPLIILSLSLPFLCINFPIGSLLNASGRQNRQTVHLAIGVVATICFNIALIPSFGIAGAAIASLASTLTVYFFGIYVSHRITGFSWSESIFIFLRIVTAGLSCFTATVAVRLFLPWYFAVVVGAIVYVGVLWLTRIISHETVREIRLILTR